MFLYLAQDLKLKGLEQTEYQQPNKIQLKPDIEFEIPSENVDKILNAEVNENKDPFVTTEATQGSNFSFNSGNHYDDLDLQITSTIEMSKNGWSCKMCGKMFKSKLQMMEHSERHVKGRSFTCIKCPTVSRSRSVMKKT